MSGYEVTRHQHVDTYIFGHKLFTSYVTTLYRDAWQYDGKLSTITHIYITNYKVVIRVLNKSHDTYIYISTLNNTLHNRNLHMHCNMVDFGSDAFQIKVQIGNIRCLINCYSML